MAQNRRNMNIYICIGGREGKERREQMRVGPSVEIPGQNIEVYSCDKKRDSAQKKVVRAKGSADKGIVYCL